MQISTEEITRYHRQIILPEIGMAGQCRLKQATVFIAGMGGLGSVSAYYLAAAGMGSLRIVDGDVVESGNLNRQWLHRTGDIGKPKTQSAVEKLREFNPQCRITPIQTLITNENIREMITGVTVILDGTDNLKTRKILNQASISANIPFIFAGVDGFSGMVGTFIPGKTPCLECLFSTDIVRRDPIGIIGPTAGVVAAIQSMETIKLILGIGDLLTRKLLLFNGKNMSFRHVVMEKNPDCPVCGCKREESPTTENTNR